MSTVTGQNVLDSACRALNASSADDAELIWWTAAELLRYADQAAKRFGRTCGAFADRDDSQAVAGGTATYTLPEGQVSVLHVSTDGTALRVATSDELAALDDDWMTTAGAVERYALDVLGLGTLTIYRIPAIAATPRIVYHYAPGFATADAPITVPAVFADYLRYRTLGEARRKTSDAAAPEIAAHSDERANLYEQIFTGYYGGTQ